MKYCVYDASLKLKICEEYATSQTSYRKLSEKYCINLSTIASWIQRYKLMNKIIPAQEKTDFYKISANEIKQSRDLTFEDKIIPLTLNGINIQTNKEGIKAIFEAVLK